MLYDWKQKKFDFIIFFEIQHASLTTIRSHHLSFYFHSSLASSNVCFVYWLLLATPYVKTNVITCVRLFKVQTMSICVQLVPNFLSIKVISPKFCFEFMLISPLTPHFWHWYDQWSPTIYSPSLLLLPCSYVRPIDPYDSNITTIFSLKIYFLLTKCGVRGVVFSMGFAWVGNGAVGTQLHLVELVLVKLLPLQLE